MKNYQITQWCAAFIRQQVQEGDFCIDATMGNGNDTLLLSQIIYCLCHHYSCYPRCQRTFAPESEMGKDLDEPIVQYVMSGIFIARIAVAYRKHLLGIKGIQFLTCGILSCPAALYQFYFIFQCQCYFLRTPLRVVC